MKNFINNPLEKFCENNLILSKLLRQGIPNNTAIQIIYGKEDYIQIIYDTKGLLEDSHGEGHADMKLLDANTKREIEPKQNNL